MKIAIIYNRDSQAVINLFGQQNKEKYGMQTIHAIRDALKSYGHIVKTFEGDKSIIRNLEEFMPTVISGERPGFVFNLSYGIQGRSRYTHIPAILEMLGIPYIGSAPATHAMALDKVVTKMILLQNGLPTPRFAVLEKPSDPILEPLQYPLIIKPKDEAASFGLKIVRNEQELREGAQYIYDEFKGDTLIEEYIDGREFNVGLLGNEDVEALPVVELTFGEGDKIFTQEDKSSANTGRVKRVCPAALNQVDVNRIQQLAIKTFKAIGCNDCARVDFRMDNEGNIYILEVNSMASLSQTASYVFAAAKIGLDYSALVNRLIETASARYFGMVDEFVTDNTLVTDSRSKLLRHVTSSRDKIEDELKYWTNFSRDINHPTGISTVKRKFGERLAKLGFRLNESMNAASDYVLWETKDGYKNGTLIVVPLDVPSETESHRTFRRDPEWLFGEGIGSSSAGITCLLRAIDAIKGTKGKLREHIGIFAYMDESKGMRHSGKILHKLSVDASEVLILQPGSSNNKFIIGRRGMRKYRLLIERDSLRPGSKNKSKDCYEWFSERYQRILEEAKKYKKLDITVNDLQITGNHHLRPNRLIGTIYLSYGSTEDADKIETDIRKIFKSANRSISASFGKLEERPVMRTSQNQEEILKSLEEISQHFGFAFGTDTSLMPSAGGDVHIETPCVCGLSPSAKNIYTDNECIDRSELIQKTVVLATCLSQDTK